MTIRVGDTVEIVASTRQDGILTDPTALTLVVTDPLGGTTSYNWPIPLTVVHDSVGQFHVNKVVNIPGNWTFVWSSTGAVVSSQSNGFVVEPLFETITITVQNQAPSPLPGANVKVYSNEVTIVAGGVTNSFGQITSICLPGTYTIELSLLKTVFSNPYTITVTNTGGVTPQSFTLSGTSLSISETAVPNKVKLFGHIIGLDGHPAGDIRIEVSNLQYGSYKPLLSPGSGSDTGINPINMMITSQKREVRSDYTGYWEIDVVADSLVRVEILDIRFNKIFRVPNDSRFPTLNIADARPDPGTGGEVGVTTDIPGRDVLSSNN